MKHFYAGTFMSRADLANIGVDYPVKLEYYKTEQNDVSKNNKEEIKYVIEIIKTSYKKEKTKVENSKITEKTVNRILEILKRNQVTPVCAEYIIEDLLKEMTLLGTGLKKVI